MDRRIQLVLSLVDDDPSVSLNLRRFAERVNLSTSRLRHLVKEEKGLSIQRYQRERRMQQAGELLVTTFLSIKEIRTAVGINSDSHFACDFKRTFGLTPSQYRKARASASANQDNQ